MKITTAIFDLDGTLLNTLGDLTDSVNCSLLRHGYPAATEEQVRARVGNGVRNLIRLSLPEDAPESLIDTCLDEFRTAYEQRMMNRTQPYDGITALLKTLRRSGVAVGVLSNKYDLAAKALIRHYFGDLCQITYGERPDTPRKPDPAGALSLLRELGGDPAATLYIGDSDTDIKTAHNAGLKAVGVTWGFRDADVLAAADALVRTPAELLTLFERGLPAVDAVCDAFTARGFRFTYFPLRGDALPYLTDLCRGKNVTFGGSQTLAQIGLMDALQGHATVHSHSITPGQFHQDSEVYICSANALSESGEVVNIDGNCNRVAGTLFGPKHCVFVCGINKLCTDLTGAIERARSIAAPKNAKRLGCQTPCAIDGICHDCRSKNRICRALVVHMAPPMLMDACEIVLIGENLGF